MVKAFLCYWGRGYRDAPMYKEVGIEFFTEDYGYTPEDIERINDMDIHECVDLTDSELGCGEHTIVRLMERGDETTHTK